MVTCPGSGRRTSPTGSTAFPEVRCPECHYYGSPVKKYGEHFIRSHKPKAKGDTQVRFVLHIDTDNAAFEDEGEIPRILRKVAQQIENGQDIAMFQTIRDINGNDVGRYALKDASYV